MPVSYWGPAQFTPVWVKLEGDGLIEAMKKKTGAENYILSRRWGEASCVMSHYASRNYIRNSEGLLWKIRELCGFSAFPSSSAGRLWKLAGNDGRWGMAHQSFPAVEFNLYDPETGRTEALPLWSTTRRLRPRKDYIATYEQFWVALPGPDGERPFLAHGIYRQTAGGIQRQWQRCLHATDVPWWRFLFPFLYYISRFILCWNAVILL